MSVHTKQIKFSAQCFVQWLLKDNFKTSDLLTVDKVPEIMREPYIYTGYRPVYRSWKYYVHSILHIHNETLNIWTHFIGFFVILFYLAHVLKDYDAINDKVAWPVITFGVCSLLSTVVSSIAHLLHSKSPWHHHTLFMLDYGAVSFYGYGIGVGSIFISSSADFRYALHAWYLPANILVSACVFYMFCTARVTFAEEVEKRKKLMIVSTALQGLFLFAPLVPRYTGCFWEPTCSMTSLNHITLVVLLDVLCAVTFSALIPERWLPGQCDIFGHSHQIFHVVAVITMTAKISAMKHDINILGVSTEVIPSAAGLAVSIAVLMLLYGFVYRYFLHCIKSVPCRKRKEKTK